MKPAQADETSRQPLNISKKKYIPTKKATKKLLMNFDYFYNYKYIYCGENGVSKNY